MIPVYLSVDLGGTSLRMALLDEKGKILTLQNISSDLVREESALIQMLSQEAELFRFRAEKIEGEIRGMALGIPGLVDSARGIVVQSPHFPAWNEIPLRDLLQARLPFPLVMDNDANQAALGEAWQGAGRNWSDFIMVTLGTGIGGGIIRDGKIFHGPNGFAGEIGHMVIERKGLAGALGSRGTLESIASQSGLKLQVEHLQNSANSSALSKDFQALNIRDTALPEKLSALAKGGDKDALALWREFGATLGCGIISLSLAFGYERFLIGGGLCAAWEFFADGMKQEVQGRTYRSLAQRIEIMPAELGNMAGLLGGVRLIQTTQLSNCPPS